MVSLPALRCVYGSALSLFLPLRSGVPQAPPVLTSSVPAPLALLAPGVGDCHPRAARVACARLPSPLAPPFPGFFYSPCFHGWCFAWLSSSAPTASAGGALASVAQAFAIPLPTLRAGPGTGSTKPREKRKKRNKMVQKTVKKREKK